MARRSSGRVLPTLDEEQALWAGGCHSVAGLDEAGRGAWAGPVVAAAVVLPTDPDVARRLAGVADSKQLTARQRDTLFEVVRAEAAGSGVGIVSSSDIDTLGIAEATRLAMQAAVQDLAVAPDFLLIDYIRLPALSIRQHSLPKGDSLVLSIAAASIVAKVTRDRLMAELAHDFPGYGLERHKGYGTADHRAALLSKGPCPIHRRSFRPVSGMQLRLPCLESPDKSGSPHTQVQDSWTCPGVFMDSRAASARASDWKGDVPMGGGPS